MRKSLWSLVMITCTVGLTLVMLLSSSEEPAEARIVTVQRGDVHQVVAISGRIAYADERIAYAGTNGIVSQICVTPGQRVGEGEALVRFESELQEGMLAAFAANTEQISGTAPAEWIEQRLTMDSTVVRADAACTVRQLLVQENMPVTVGTPVARMTSNQQEIVCTVCSTDAKKLQPGMWAWISAEGEPLGFAEVMAIGALSADLLSGMTAAQVRLRPEAHIELPEGAAVEADVYLAGSDDALTLPIEAITGRNTVWWVDDGRCTEIPVEIVMTDEILAWVVLPEGIAVAIGEFEEGQRVAEAAR